MSVNVGIDVHRKRSQVSRVRLALVLELLDDLELEPHDRELRRCILHGAAAVGGWLLTGQVFRSMAAR
jgi:hypothetical protein